MKTLNQFYLHHHKLALNLQYKFLWMIILFRIIHPFLHKPHLNQICHLQMTNKWIFLSHFGSTMLMLVSLYTHVHALLQTNFLLAQLLLIRIESDRFLTDNKQYVLQTSVAKGFWPNFFLSCSRTHGLVTAIFIWFYEQQ